MSTAEWTQAEWVQGDTVRIGLLRAGTIIDAVDGLRWVVIGDGQSDTVLVMPHDRKGERDYFWDVAMVRPAGRIK